MEYCEADTNNTYMLHKTFREIEFKDKLNKLHKQLDNCDDINERAIIARKIQRLKYKYM